MKNKIDADVSLVFAYGSNLDREDLKAWCERHGQAEPLKEVLGRAYLLDYELCFSAPSRSRKGGVLDIRPRRGGVVEGVVYRVDQDGLRTLDKKEGAPNLYERHPVTLADEHGTLFPAVTYSIPATRAQPFVQPDPAYVQVVRRGCITHGLDVEQLEEASRNVHPTGQVNSVFVYGTCIRGEERFDALAKVAEFECILTAVGSGEMIHLGHYPGVTDAPDASIQGEFMRVKNIQPVLELLDSIEGFRGYEDTSDSLFLRTLCSVDVGEGRRRRAWTYRFATPIKSVTKIASGDWRAACGRKTSFMRELFDAYCGSDRERLNTALRQCQPSVLIDPSASPVDEFRDGTVSERRLAKITGNWVCIPST